jgi:hypothetical protein
MALIVVLYVIDRNYRVFLEAANLRATLLERRSSPELSQTISRLYESQRVGLAFDMVYVGLTTATFVIGFLVVSEPRLLDVLAVAYFGGLAFLALITKLLRTRPWIYFEINGFTFKKKTPILVTVANFAKRPIKLEKEKEVWAVYAEDDAAVDDPIRRKAPEKEIVIGAHSDHRWQIDTDGEDLQLGMYRVVYKGHIYADVSKGPFRRYKLLRKGDQGWDSREMWDRAPRFRIVD